MMPGTGESLTTIVFVDVEGSTGLVDRLGDAAGTRAVLGQLDVVRDRLASYGGHEVKSLGDGLLLTFTSPRQAVAFGVACQRALGDSAPRVRIGVNTGEVVDLAEDPMGGAVNAAARIADRAGGGEVLVSDVVRQLAGATPVVRFVDRGRARLKGFAEPWQLWAALDGTSPVEGPTTIGRRAELAVVNQLVTALATGTGRALLIEGEAGIGKSHLLTSLVHSARAARMTVVEVAADEIVRRPGHLAHVLAADERLPGPQRSQLLDLLHRTTGDGDPEDLSYAVIERCADALEMLTRDGPVMLVAEDLHWADDLSLGVIRTAIQRTSSSPLAVVGALRPVPRPVLLDRTLETLVKGGGRHLRLAPLDELDVQALAAALTGAAPGSRLRERLAATGGNPLFVSELLRSFDEEQQLRIEAGVAEISESAVAATLGATLIRRLSWLPEGTRDLLRLASLLGTSFTLTELSAVTGRTVVEVASWLRDAMLAGLVVGEGERLSFRHDLVREAVYDDMLPAERRDLHHAAGQALARAGAPLQQVAWQYSRGATTGDLEAVGWLVRAADEVMSVAPSAAIELFEAALALAPPWWPQRSQIQARLIEPLAWCGRFERAEELAASVLATSPDPQLAFEVVRGMAAVHGNRGNIASAIADLHQAAEMPGAPEVEAGRMLCFSTQLEALMGTTSIDEASVRTDRYLAMASEAGDVTGQCVALQVLGTVESLAGRLDVARAHLQRATALHDSGHVRTTSYIIPDLLYAGALLYLDRIEEGLRATYQSRRRHIERGALTQLPLSHMLSAATHFYTGAWPDADAEIDAGMTVADESESRNFVLFSRALLARMAISRGRLDDAAAHIARGFGELASGSLFGADWLFDAHAEHQAASGDPAAGLATAVLMWGQTAHLRFFYGYRDRSLLLVRLALANHREDVAVEALECLEEGARRAPARSALGFAVQARGLLRRDTALLGEALEHFRATPFRPFIARCCEDLAAQLAADGDRGRAVALLEEAAELYAAIGAEGDLTRVDGELGRVAGRALAVRASRPSFGWASLTPMELTVSDLVAEGLTNPEIGERLHISRRTVESHLAHIFRKLDFGTRAQLAAEVVRRVSS
jgi:class 3 adenylate cyclase/DNA-binding CsgD family transcriptional regulator/tetratricopeptide (TPR) repeat protein